MDSIASSRLFFDEIVGVNAADLPLDLIDNLRPRIYEILSREADRRFYIKAHDAYLLTPDGEPMFPAIATWGVIHIVRNPLDVAISYAYHVGIDIDRAIRALCDQENSFCYNTAKLPDQLRQRLLDWSSHAASWLNAPLPRLTIRYEDMLASPKKVFSAVARFCDLKVTEADVTSAVEATRIERLQQLEGQRRFRETPRGNARFFRRGVAGDWKTVLTPEQVARIIVQHGDMMERLGYATDL
ncbi:Sulfotransferase [Gammaproteobacteria bacterium]